MYGSEGEVRGRNSPIDSIKSLMGKGRSQELEVRSHEKWELYEEVEVRIVPQFFCHNHPKILALCSSFYSKAGTFLIEKRLKPLYFKTLIINQQALIIKKI